MLLTCMLYYIERMRLVANTVLCENIVQKYSINIPLKTFHLFKRYRHFQN